MKKKEDLDESGMDSEDNYVYKGDKYFKCTTKHLTSFTAGNYYKKSSSSSGISTLAIVFIIIGCVLVLAIIILIILLKRRKNSGNIEEIKKDDGIMEITN